MDLDDLLGGDTPNTADPLALDDVLGDPTLAPTTTNNNNNINNNNNNINKEVSSSSELKQQNIEIPKPRRPAMKGPIPPRMHPVKLTHFREPPPHVKQYVTNACYYANQISLIANDGSREKRGIVINDTNIYIMAEEAKVVRTIPLTYVEAIVMQDVITVKSLGITKEWQTQVVLQLSEGPDIYFALSEDKKKDPSTGRSYSEKMPVLEVVLAELLRTYDVDLLICSLKENEFIQNIVKWSVTDITMRRECEELLSYRTSLTATLKDIIKNDAKHIVARNQIEASGASQTVTTLLKEIQIVESKNEMMNSALQQTKASLAKCKIKEEELRDTLAAKEKSRELIIQERVAAKQGELITRQAREYDLMKSAHQTEMRHLNLLKSLLKSRVEKHNTSSSSNININNITPAEIEAGLAQISQLQNFSKNRKTAATEALAEAKKHLANSKISLRQIKEEVEILRKLHESGKPIPATFNQEMAPTFLPVRLSEEKNMSDQSMEIELNTPPTVNNNNNNSVKGEINTNKKASVLDLSDDDDIDILPPPPAKQQQNKQPATNIKPTIIFDDDDL